MKSLSVALSQTKCKNAGLPFVPNSLYLTCLLGLSYWIVFNWLIPQLFSIELRVTQDSRKNAKVQKCKSAKMQKMPGCLLHLIVYLAFQLKPVLQAPEWQRFSDSEGLVSG